MQLTLMVCGRRSVVVEVKVEVEGFFEEVDKEVLLIEDGRGSRSEGLALKVEVEARVEADERFVLFGGGFVRMAWAGKLISMYVRKAVLLVFVPAWAV